MDGILSVEHLSVQLDGRALLKDVSFTIGAGEAVLLSGPNGIGKSTLLKAIMGLETDKKQLSGQILFRGHGDILSLKSEEMQRFRRSIAYVPQRDDYSTLGNVRVGDVISDSMRAFSGRSLSCAQVNALIDEWLPRRQDGRRVFDANARPGKFSGGEQRLLSVLSVIATRAGAELFIIDEPLNNLDFMNARNISNVINRVIRGNPRAALLMISHCRIFPFITREIALTAQGAHDVSERYACHSCFGVANSQGYFE